MSGVYWDRGRRCVNQDSLTLQQALTRRGRMVLAAVSDGIGGLSEGENASGFITEKLAELFYGQLAELACRKKGKRFLKKSVLRCFYEMNEELRRYGQGKEISLGATVSLLFLWGKRYMIFHLGDSRIYLYNRKGVSLLTGDHGGAGGITKCMGSFPFQYPDIHFGRIYGRSGFLLCTDGFWELIEEKKMQHCLKKAKTPEEWVKLMEEIVRKNGQGKNMDNYSAVAVWVE